VLNKTQIDEYRALGYVVFPAFFTAAEVAALHAETDRIFALDRVEHLRAASGEFLGTTAMERCSELFQRLLREPRLLAIAEQLLDSAVYCHQYKIIVKQALGQLSLPWHQDYGPWAHHDGMPTSAALSLGIYLDDVTEFNGPITFIPRSHHAGLLPYEVIPVPGTTPIPSLPAATVKHYAEQHGITAPKGPPGTCVIFDSCLAHASSPNLTPWPRNLIYLSYNRIDNAIRKPTRATHFANQDFTPLTRLTDSLLQ
jgi:ectoine hydroxylase